MIRSNKTELLGTRVTAEFKDDFYLACANVQKLPAEVLRELAEEFEAQNRVSKKKKAK